MYLENPKRFDFVAKLYNADGTALNTFQARVENGILTIPEFNADFKHDLESGRTDYFDPNYQLVSLNVYEITSKSDYLLVGVFTSGTSAEVLMGRFPGINLGNKLIIKSIEDFSKK